MSGITIIDWATVYEKGTRLAGGWRSIADLMRSTTDHPANVVFVRHRDIHPPGTGKYGHQTMTVGRPFIRNLDNVSHVVGQMTLERLVE